MKTWTFTCPQDKVLRALFSNRDHSSPVVTCNTIVNCGNVCCFFAIINYRVACLIVIIISLRFIDNSTAMYTPLDHPPSCICQVLWTLNEHRYSSVCKLLNLQCVFSLRIPTHCVPCSRALFGI